MSAKPSVVLRVASVERSANFWTQLPGFQEGHAHHSASLTEVLDADGDLLLFAGHDAGDVSDLVGARANTAKEGELFIYRSEDPDAVRRVLAAGGHEVPDVHEKPWGDRTLQITDPDGYRLRFVQVADLSFDEILNLYTSVPGRLATLLSEIGEPGLEVMDTKSAWNVRAIGHHVCDGDVLWSGALMAALMNSGCSYQHDWYTSDQACLDTLAYASRPLNGASDSFTAYRRSVAELLRSIPDAADRHVLFQNHYRDERRKLTVLDIIRRRTVHSMEHIEEMREIVLQASA
jgi:catechol 2,3-dioxygenase-like lactoylglutathione lyase family enzyme